ncbi:Leukotriene A-4 hydrolase [Entophlyctis luteolus]|nr:Leukotriene A-4 hydrolase [Entophlyctis luteolus]
MSATRHGGDPHSFANTRDVLVHSIHLAVECDFAACELVGCVALECALLADGVRALVLDTKALRIHSVLVADAPAAFSLDAPHDCYGAALRISLPQGLAAGSRVSVTVRYSTSKEGCSAAQWLTASQTVGKRHPYLFTQCQPIYARTLLPIQDTPFAKFKCKYTADITCPSELRALMSAVLTGERTEGTKRVFSFSQNISIPSYLIAIAVGNIAGQRVGPRTTVWSEPEVVESAAWEFADTELFIKTGEDFLTPYVWGVYDLLVLPASFPYGGMENPCLVRLPPGGHG